MTEVGQLRASLSANSAGFANDMKRARDAVRQNASGMEEAMYKVQDAFEGALRATKVLGAAAIAGAGAISVLVKQSIDSADSMLKMSQSSGIAIEELSALAHAGRLSGVETEALGSAMVKLTKGMSDAAMGTGEALKAYNALGISVKDANGNLKSADVVMNEIADKFGSFEDGANKTALAVALFGKSGAEMIPMLNRGSKGLQDAAKEADRLGRIIGSNTAQAAERFNDNLTRLNAVKKGFSNQIMTAVLPSLESLSGRLFESASSADIMDRSSRAAAAGVKLLMSSGVILVGVFKTLGEYLGGVAAAAMQLFSGNFKAAMEVASQAGADFSENIKSTIGNVDAIWEAEAAKVEKAAPEIGQRLAAPMMAAVGATEQAVERQNEVLQKRLEKLQEHFASEKELALMAYNERVAAIQELEDAKIGTDAEREELRLKVAQEYADRLAEIEARAEKEKIAREEGTANAINSIKQTGYNQGIALLQKFADKNKAIAAVLIALQTAKAVKDIQIQAASASAQVLAYGQVEAAAHSALFNYPAAAAALARASAAASAIQANAQFSSGLAIASGVVDFARLGSSSSSGNSPQPAVNTSANPINPATNQEIGQVQTVQTRELRVVVEGDGPHSQSMRKLLVDLAATAEDMGGINKLVVG